MNDENKKFIDDKIEHIESDIEKIQTKPNNKLGILSVMINFIFL